MDNIRIVMDDTSLTELENRYGAALTQKAVRITSTYVQKMQRDAQRSIVEAGHVDTGRLADSIKSNVEESSQKVTGEVCTHIKYTQFNLEDTKHDADSIFHSVPFAVAPSLFIWVKRNKIIYQKQNKDRKGKTNKLGGGWYFMSKKGKAYPINIKTGGLVVKREPVKYFTIPFEKLAPEYLKKLAAAVSRE